MNLNFQRVLPDRKFHCKAPPFLTGFSLVEVIVASFIFMVVLSALYIVLNIGDKINYEGAARVDLQSNIRQVLDIITQDVRQARLTDIAVITNTCDYLKFHRAKGCCTVEDGREKADLSTYYIEYAYYGDPDYKITRQILDASENVLETRDFYNIYGSPFYTLDNAGAKQPLTGHTTDFLNSTVLIIEINGQTEVRGSRTLSLTLEELAKIRNE